jgi:DNA (cytosine-5)-methyltransferase 1
MADFLDKTFPIEHAVSNKAKRGIINPSRLKKKYTQVDGQIALCQARCQEYNLRGDFVSKEYLNKFVLSNKLKKTVLRFGKPDPEIAKTILSTS